MNIIKLDAINSTNDFLKDLMRKQHLENYTVVIANDQQKGKGQRDSNWLSEAGKNLTCSVLIKDLIPEPSMLFSLNIAVANSVYETLIGLTNKNIAIKWPNDIMAENKKIAGILIENVIQQKGEIFSVIGVGLNINQKYFGILKNVTSLAVLEDRQFNLDLILNTFLSNLKQNISLISNEKTNLLWELYLEKLFKKEIPITFEDQNQRKFMGIIKGVSSTGQLQVLLENDSIQEYAVKEIKMLY